MATKAKILMVVNIFSNVVLCDHQLGFLQNLAECRMLISVKESIESSKRATNE